MTSQVIKRFLGGHCGSSYLNQRFEASIRARLATESYLWSHQNSKTLDSIIHTCVMNEFENVTKRAYPEETKIDVDKGWYTSYTIPGLEDNEDKGFHRSDLGITRYVTQPKVRSILTEHQTTTRGYLHSCAHTILVVNHGATSWSLQARSLSQSRSIPNTFFSL
jgi:hypothetical protein